MPTLMLVALLVNVEITTERVDLIDCSVWRKNEALLRSFTALIKTEKCCSKAYKYEIAGLLTGSILHF